MQVEEVDPLYKLSMERMQSQPGEEEEERIACQRTLVAVEVGNESSCLCNAPSTILILTLTIATYPLLGGGGLTGSMCASLQCGFPGTGEYRDVLCRTVPHALQQQQQQQ
jgi:hypothetical protein